MIIRLILIISNVFCQRDNCSRNVIYLCCHGFSFALVEQVLTICLLLDLRLEYELIFSNELKFIKRLYEILDQYNISYIKNKKYIRASMTNYRSTCESPENHLGNTNSVEWLGFCLAMSRIENITVDQFNPNDNIDNIKPKFYHLQSTALEFIKPYVFEWKK